MLKRLLIWSLFYFAFAVTLHAVAPDVPMPFYIAYFVACWFIVTYAVWRLGRVK